jgi:hypothetical protein
MRHTDFAGLTELEPGESIGLDDFGLQSRNPRLIDFFLQLGARLHRHDAHTALATPTVAPGLAVANTGGALPGGVDFTVGYTAVDAFGGETLLSPDDTIALPTSVDAPDSVGTLTMDYTGGTLGAGTYYYVKTWVDGAGGETTASGVAEIDRDPGGATARVQFTNLNASIPAGATGWRIYKSAMGGLFGLVASGNTATWTDDGSAATDAAVRPPTANTTNSANVVTITIPSAGQLPAGATGFRIYGTFGVSFSDPALIREEPIANAGDAFEVTAWAPLLGTPPVVATAIAGAAKIDPDTELIDFPWKRSVTTSSALPANGNTLGDARVTRDTLHMWMWDGGQWRDLTAIAQEPEGWTTVPDSPTGAVNWESSADASHEAASYYRTRDGVVRFKGTMTSLAGFTYGAASATVAEMPTGYRPDVGVGESLEFLCPFFATGGSTWHLVRVAAWDTGDVTIEGHMPGSASAEAGGWVDLSAVSFRARQPMLRWASDSLIFTDSATAVTP